MAVGRRPPFLVTWTSLYDFSNSCSWLSQSDWLKQEREKTWASQKLLLLTIVSIVTGCHFFISAFLSWAYRPTLIYCWRQVSRVMSSRREDPWAPSGGWLLHMDLVTHYLWYPLYVKAAHLHAMYEAWISHSLLSFCLISMQFGEKGKSCPVQSNKA